MIVVYHSEGHFGLPAYGLWPLSFAVGFFFVLSGFVLTHVYPTLEGVGARRFWWARFARIWPGYLASLALVALLIPSGVPDAFTHRLSASRLIANLLLVQCWLPACGPFVSINGPAWSVSIEIAFYLLFPWLIRRFERNGWLKLLAALALANLVVTLAFAARLTDDGPAGQQLRAVDVILFHPASRLFEFTAGMAMALAYRGLRGRVRIGPFVATAVEAAAVAWPAWVLAHGEGWNRWADGPLLLWLCYVGLSAAIFSPLVLVMALQHGYLSRLLRLRPLVLLGEASYALYLIHQTVLRYYFAHEVQLGRLPDWLTYAALWGLMLLTADLIWLLIERPARAGLLRLAGPRRGGSPHPAAPPAAPASPPRTAAGRWLWPAAKAAFALAAWSLVVYAAEHGPVVAAVSPAQAQVSVEDSLPASRGVRFGDDLVLLGATPVRHADAIDLDLVWSARRGQRLTESVAVHLTDAGGTILAQGDYPQSATRGDVAAGATWRDHVRVPLGPRPERVRNLGLGIFKAGGEMLPADRGPRDYNGGRLLLALEPHLPLIDEARAAEVVEAADPATRGVRFGGRVTLLGAACSPLPDGGLALSLAWRSEQLQRLPYSVGVHVLDADRHFVAQADYPQDTSASVAHAGEVWLDELEIPARQAKGAAGIGLGLFSPDGPLKREGGEPASGDDRLWVPVPSRP